MFGVPVPSVPMFCVPMPGVLVPGVLVPSVLLPKGDSMNVMGECFVCKCLVCHEIGNILRASVVSAISAIAKRWALFVLLSGVPQCLVSHSAWLATVPGGPQCLMCHSAWCATKPGMPQCLVSSAS